MSGFGFRSLSQGFCLSLGKLIDVQLLWAKVLLGSIKEDGTIACPANVLEGRPVQVCKQGTYILESLRSTSEIPGSQKASAVLLQESLLRGCRRRRMMQAGSRRKARVSPITAVGCFDLWTNLQLVWQVV
jgi:hypothetical protein